MLKSLLEWWKCFEIVASGFVVGVDGWFYIFSEVSDESKPNRVASQDHKAVGDFCQPWTTNKYN